jgi:hypothetical protein
MSSDQTRKVCMLKKLFIRSGDGVLGASIALHTRKRIMNFALGRMGWFMPAISFDQLAMYLRGNKNFNESRKGPNLTQPGLELPDGAGEPIIRKRFAVNADHIRAMLA